MIRRLLNIFSLLLMLCVPPHTVVMAQDLSFKHVTIENGLSSNIIYSVAQDNRGFIWLATPQGLNRYDGHEIKVYYHDREDSTTISHDNVLKLLPSHDGTLWVGTEGGLNHFDLNLGTFIRYQHVESDSTSLSSNDISELYEDTDHVLWVGTYGGGLNKLVLKESNGEQVAAITYYRHKFKDPTTLSNDDIFALHRTQDGVLWIGTGEGLNRFDEKTGAFSLYEHPSGRMTGLTNAEILDIHESPDSTLWIGTNAGLYRLKPKTGQIISYRHRNSDHTSLSHDTVRDIHETDEGVFWIATHGGIDRFDPDTGLFSRHRHRNKDGTSLSNNQVFEIIQASDGTLWAATFGGLNRFDSEGESFVLYTHSERDPNSLSDINVRFIHESYDGTIWIGTLNGLNRLDPITNQFTRYHHNPDDSNSLSHNFIRAIHEAEDGMIWIGTQGGGLNSFDPRTKKFIRYPHRFNPDASLNYDNVRALYVNRDNTLWLGTERGLKHFNPENKQLISYSRQSGTYLSNNEIRTIYPTGEGTFWIGTWGGGLNHFDPVSGIFTPFRYQKDDENSLNNDAVWTIHKSVKGTFWIGTDAGLNHLNQKNKHDLTSVSFIRYSSRNTNYDRGPVRSIIEDNNGYLWLGLGSGKIARFNPENNRFRYFDAPAIQRVGSFTRGATLTRQGKMYFSGYGGMVGFDPAKIQVNEQPPDLVLTALKLFNEPVYPGLGSPLDAGIAHTESIILDHDEHDISLDFTAFDYSDPAGIRFNYRLMPYDRDWRGITAQRTATYTSLLPGDYTFEIKAVNSAGIWTEKNRALSITILPPWWRSSGAYLAYGIFLVFGIVVVDRSLRRRLVRQERERIRERELEQAHRLKTAFDKLDEAHRSLEAEKVKTEEQAEQLRELDRAKSRFFANVSHEFRTPLTLIIGPLEDLQKDIQKRIDNDIGTQVGLALRNAYRVLDLINEILDVAKIESGQLNLRIYESDFTRFIQNLTQAFFPLAERKQIQFRVEALPEPVPVYFDPDQLEKVFTNLLSNAFKFTPEGGTIRVAVVMDQTAGSVGQIHVSIKDNGPGIPKKDLPHIFGRFYQVDESFSRLQPGTGIGLSLAKDLVELHGGQILVESEEGFGSTFTVKLIQGRDHLPEAYILDPPPIQAGFPEDFSQSTPRARRLLSQEKAMSSISSLNESDSDKTTILIVEDNAEVRDYIKKHLVSAYHIIEAGNGREGLEVAKANLPDLIISDVMMPEMDGYELCQTLKSTSETSFIPIILLTARATTADKVDGLHGGADDYITKPFDIHELVARVDNLIQSRRQILHAIQNETPKLKPSYMDISSADQVFLEQVQTVLEDHLNDDAFNVEILADKMGLDRSNLYRRMRTLLDQSPTNLIWTFRLERAAQLLEGQAGSVSEVAYSVGFKSVSHFSRRFQKHFSMSPSEFSADKRISK